MQTVRVRLPSVALTTTLALAIEQGMEWQMNDGNGTISFDPDDDNTVVTIWGPDD